WRCCCWCSWPRCACWFPRWSGDDRCAATPAPVRELTAASRPLVSQQTNQVGGGFARADQRQIQPLAPEEVPGHGPDLVGGDGGRARMRSACWVCSVAVVCRRGRGGGWLFSDGAKEGRLPAGRRGAMRATALTTCRCFKLPAAATSVAEVT